MLHALVPLMKKVYHLHCNLIKKSKRPLWTIICLALGILGENERKYLRPDLKEVAVYGA